MLVALEEMKARLGLADASQDVFLTEQIAVVSDSIEGYCGRKFLQATYVETFYKNEMVNLKNESLTMFHYPIVSVGQIKEIDNLYLLVLGEYRMSKGYGKIKRLSGYSFVDFFTNSEGIEITYDAGFAQTPSPIKEVVHSLVEERYNKKISGVNLNFGNDVQRVSIPGTISVDFDYSLQANERSSAYGMILGNYLNVLDPYRSERRVIGNIREIYVN